MDEQQEEFANLPNLFGPALSITTNLPTRKLTPSKRSLTAVPISSISGATPSPSPSSSSSTPTTTTSPAPVAKKVRTTPTDVTLAMLYELVQERFDELEQKITQTTGLVSTITTSTPTPIPSFSTPPPPRINLNLGKCEAIKHNTTDRCKVDATSYSAVDPTRAVCQYHPRSTKFIPRD